MTDTAFPSPFFSAIQTEALWKPFNCSRSALIEEHYQRYIQTPNAARYLAYNNTYGRFELDFQSKLQIELPSNVRRSIERVTISSDSGLPPLQ